MIENRKVSISVLGFTENTVLRLVSWVVRGVLKSLRNKFIYF